MPSIFDGLGAIGAGVLGAPVTIYPGGGAGVEIQAIVRTKPFEAAGEYGEPITVHEPTLRAVASVVVNLREDDRVTAGGVNYRIVRRLPSVSPASDRLETFVLEKDE
ncbi:MAG: hypothetical protein AAFN94_00825 [Pseudomonadota bacterium]